MEPNSRRPFWDRLSSKAVARGIPIFFLLVIHSPISAQSDRRNEQWVGTWATATVARAPQSQAPQGQPAPLNFNNQTLRQIVHTSVGGERVRVVLTNTFGTGPLVVGAAHIALRDNGATLKRQSVQALTFGGSPTTKIPPGAVMISDSVNLTIPALADLAIDIYLPGNTAGTTSPLTTHTLALQTNYVSATGNHSGATEFPVMTTTQSAFYLARVEVAGSDQTGAVVTFGDSITDGTRSTPDTNNRWPDRLARRLMQQNIKMGVLNVGISGNRLLSDRASVNALARFDRDVLAVPGVTHVIVLLGINDIGDIGNTSAQNPSPTAADLITGHRQLIERAHAHRLKIYGATLTPCEGGSNCTAPQAEEKRQIFDALNHWIRTGKAYDGVIDFNEVVRDPNQPTKFLPQYDSGDHTHPSDAGYDAMANAVDLLLFKASTVPAQR